MIVKLRFFCNFSICLPRHAQNWWQIEFGPGAGEKWSVLLLEWVPCCQLGAIPPPESHHGSGSQPDGGDYDEWSNHVWSEETFGRQRRACCLLTWLVPCQPSQGHQRGHIWAGDEGFNAWSTTWSLHVRFSKDGNSSQLSHLPSIH